MENKITIVIVEDERAVADLLKTVLEANHYHVLTAKTAAERPLSAWQYSTS